MRIRYSTVDQTNKESKKTIVLLSRLTFQHQIGISSHIAVYRNSNFNKIRLNNVGNLVKQPTTKPSTIEQYVGCIVHVVMC